MSSGQNEVIARYVRAIYDLANKDKKIDQVSEQLQAIFSVLDESDKLQAFLKNPLIADEQYEQFAQELGKNIKFEKSVENFLKLLIQNGRFCLLYEISKAYQQLHVKESGQVEIEVITAEKLPENKFEDLKKNLAKELGSNILFCFTVNPSILGGLVLKIGSQMIDASVQTQIRKLQTVLKG